PQVDAMVHREMGPYLAPTPAIVTVQLPVAITAPAAAPGLTNELGIIGTDLQANPLHLSATKGRLPSMVSSELELAVPSDMAEGLHLNVGTLLPFGPVQPSQQALASARIVGILAQSSAEVGSLLPADPFGAPSACCRATVGKFGQFQAVASHDT